MYGCVAYALWVSAMYLMLNPVVCLMQFNSHGHAKVALCLPHLWLCAPPLITCTRIPSHTLLPCDFTLVSTWDSWFEYWCSLAQLPV